MKRLVICAALGALAVAPVMADAHRGDRGNRGDGKPDRGNRHVGQYIENGGKRCKPNKRGFIVAGTNAVFTVTQNPDGTWDGSVTLIADRANRHARRSGVNAEDQNPETFQLDDVKIKPGPEDVDADDRVRLIGKIQRAKKGSEKRPCPDAGFGEDGYGDPMIRRVKVLERDS